MIDKILQKLQECIKKVPILVIGSGASMQYGYAGMKKLLVHLKDSIKVEDTNWKNFLNSAEQHGLEMALSSHTLLSPETHKQIICKTWEQINDDDHDFFYKILKDEPDLALGNLISYLFDSTNNSLDIVTTNYDRLIEYSINMAGYKFFTGFQDGYLQHWQPNTNEQLFYLSNGVRHPQKRVNLWKVHGSLDWFINPEQQILSVPRCKEIPTELRPLIVTPGNDKYKETHNDPFRYIITHADRAVSKANAIICVGFGFSDPHIQPKIIEKLKDKKVLVVIIAKVLTENTKNILLDEQKSYNFIALEKYHTGTMIYTSDSEMEPPLIQSNFGIYQIF